MINVFLLFLGVFYDECEKKIRIYNYFNWLLFCYYIPILFFLSNVRPLYINGRQIFF